MTILVCSVFFNKNNYCLTLFLFIKEKKNMNRWVGMRKWWRHVKGGYRICWRLPIRCVGGSKRSKSWWRNTWIVTKEPSLYYISKRTDWVGSEKWYLLLMFSPIYADVGWVSASWKVQKSADIIYGWSLTKDQKDFIFQLRQFSIFFHTYNSYFCLYFCT